MAGGLESTITLDEVFAMVASKRVPLAAELAGYLALEIAEGADDAAGDVDPRSVHIAEEGTVAIVRRRDSISGEAEASIRAILGRLLDSSGSKTAALMAAARRRSTGSLRSLSEELEAALIPVNRAAGRRALARLAREVKRMTLRAGRSAGLAPSVPAEQAGPPSSRAVPSEEAPTARREALPELVQKAVPSDRRASIDLPPPEPPPLRRPSTGPKSLPYSGSDVDSLLEDFARSSERPDHAVARDLKAMAGLDPTPPPPNVRPPSMAPDAGVEALLAMSDPSFEPPRVGVPAPTAPPRRQTAPQPFGVVPDEAFTAPTKPPPPSPEKLPPVVLPPLSPPRPIAPFADLSDAPVEEPAPAIDMPPPPRPRARSQADLPTEPGMRKRNISRISTGEFRKSAKPRSDAWLIVLLMALIGVGVAVVWTLKPGFLTGRTPEKIAQEKAANEAARQKAVETMKANACKVSLEVTDAPPNAEILVHEGQAPVDVERMPVGTRLEFVATAEGFAPKRAVVPAGASWDSAGGGGPRYEVGVQLDKSTGKKGEVWPPGEPGSEVGGKGAPGTVHVVTTPRGAEVWLLTGLGPDARIEGLPCDQDVDVLVAGPTTLRKRLHVTAGTFAPGPEAPPEGRFAKVSAK